MIKLRFATLDGIRKTKRFKTLAGARKAAWDWVGKDADIGMTYAVSTDGVVTVAAEGCTLKALFSDTPTGRAGEEFWHIVEFDGEGYCGIGGEPYDTEAEALAAIKAMEEADHASNFHRDYYTEGWRYDEYEEPCRIEKPEPAAPAKINDDEIPF